MIGRCHIALLSAALAAGCGTTAPADDDSPDAGDGSVDDGGGLAIRFAEDGPVSVQFSAAYGFSVIVESHGAPAAGVTADLAFEGEAQDSSLESTRTVTDADGIARGRLFGGTVETTFTLRASLPTGEAARLEVRVTPTEWASVTILATYDGARVVPSYEVRLLAGANCPVVAGVPADPAESVVTVPAGDPSLQVPRDMTRVPIRVVVVGRDLDVDLLWGCTAGATIPATGTDALAVTLADLPWPRPGSHPTTTDVGLSVLAVPVADAALAPFAALLDGSKGQGRFVIDGVVDALRAAGNSAAADILAERSTVDRLDETLAADFEADGIDLEGVLAGLADGARTFLESAAVKGGIDIGEPDGAGNATGVVHWSALSDGRTEATLERAGWGPVESVVAEIGLGSSELAVGRHLMPLPLGRAVESVLISTLDPSASAWVGSGAETGALDGWLRSTVSCTAVAAVLHASADVSSVCNSDCLALACTAALQALAEASSEALRAADASATGLDLVGSCAFLDGDGRLVPEGRCDGSVHGLWSGSEVNDVAGRFTVLADGSP